MPVKRKGYTTPQLTRAKRAKRPPRPMKRMAKYSRVRSTNTHSFKRWTGGFDVQNNAGSTEKPYTMLFTFNQLINHAEFDALYDRYRIDYVMVKLQLQNNPDADRYLNNDAVINECNFYPKLWWIKDYDDGAVDTLNEFKQRSGVKCRVLRPNTTVTIKLKPAILAQLYRTVTTTGYAPKWGQWIDMAQVDVPHYGLKWILDLNGRNNPEQVWVIHVEQMIHFTCKDVR